MIRVAFFVNIDDGWLGGVSYFRNLLRAISTTENIKITPVLFTGKIANKTLLSGFPDIEIIETDILKRWTYSWIMRKFDNKLFFRDRALDSICKQYHIDLVSHINYLAGKIETPSIGWIPDFQHRHLPNLFTKKELKFRDRSFREVCHSCNGVILSSYDAKNDLRIFAPECQEKSYVLQFVVEPLADIGLSIEELEKIYGFRGKYFYVPNQFWAHKNHKILLEALVILKSHNRNVHIICTGNTTDYRNPHYFEKLNNFIKENDLSKEFIILGKVPYSHVITLSKHCKAFINPSFFEGWSTTVEEAKAIGKKIILSDIPVHREQNPEGAIYFNITDAKELAEKIWNLWESNESDVATNESDIVNKREKFAKTYEEIILSVLDR